MIDNIPLSSFGAIPSPVNGYFALSGMLDLPKRTGATEHDWGTSIEPFVDVADIELDGRKLSLNVAIRKPQLRAFLDACIACMELSIGYDSFSVVCKDEITVKEVGEYCRVSVPFWQDEVSFWPIEIDPSGNGNYTMDYFNLPKDFGIYVGSSGNLDNIAKRIEVQTTEFYKQAEYRGARTIDLSCAMHGYSFLDIYDKMNQFHSLLISPGLRSLSLRNNTLSVYFKDGVSVSVVGENIAKFNLKATVV